MNRRARLVVWTLVGAIVGFFVGVYFVTAVGIRPGDRTDLLVIAAVVALFAVAAFLWARRAPRA